VLHLAVTWNPVDVDRHPAGAVLKLQVAAVVTRLVAVAAADRHGLVATAQVIHHRQVHPKAMMVHHLAVVTLAVVAAVVVLPLDLPEVL
jgi:hypothetical protein